MESVSCKNSGIAQLKEQYLVKDHVRELNLEYVANKDKSKLLKNESQETSEPPKKKLKGQNKHRPRNEKSPKSEKLCFKVGTEGFCSFGDACCYSHDVEKYLANKPPDIGNECYLFRTFGKCPYSFSCRYASDHIKEGKNVVCEERYEQFRNKKIHFNFLSKELQKQLRRREYDFIKSNEALNSFTGNIASNKCKSKTTVVSNLGTENQNNESQKTLDSKSETNSDQNANMISTNSEHTPSANDAHSDDNDALFMPDIKMIDFKDKLYLAPLTTVGNLPFRRICKEYGVDITCSEMSLALSLLQGQQSEWALIKRHHTEDIFGIQLCGPYPDVMTRCCQLLSETTSFDFIDLNLGCPLDGIYKKGAGCGLMNRMKKLEGIIYGVTSVINMPLTLKIRTGIHGDENIAHNLIEKVKLIKRPISLITLHGRSREQRYTKSANWEYINLCNKIADPIPFFGNGDILSYEDYNLRRKETGVSGAMIARGALIKPWIFKEIKEQMHWDISANERLDILRKYTNYGLEHWGSDSEGVEKTRRFLLEWLSFLHRYIPVGLLERLPQRINERPPPYIGRNELETLMASGSCSDWVKISEMLLGPVPENFVFLPKHKANAYK